MSDIIQENEIDIFENDIELYIDLFCQKHGIESMKLESQNCWNACLSFIYKNLFRGTNRLKYNPNINNEYNKEYIYNNILPIYIDYCNLYGKEISINGFSKLTGIEYNCFMNWSQESNSIGLQIYQKLMQENESSNSDLLASGKNPVGIIARLNRHHGWNSPYTNNGSKSQQSVTALPNFQENNALAIDTTLKSP